MTAHSHSDTFDCPHCGEELPLGMKRCRTCGASDDCGWEEAEAQYADGRYDSDDDFDYDDFIAREFGTDGGPPLAETRDLQFRLVILGIVVAMLLPLILAYVW